MTCILLGGFEKNPNVSSRHVWAVFRVLGIHNFVIFFKGGARNKIANRNHVGMSRGPALSKKGSILKGTVFKHPNNDALITQFRRLCTNLIYLLKIETLPK